MQKGEIARSRSQTQVCPACEPQVLTSHKAAEQKSARCLTCQLDLKKKGCRSAEPTKCYSNNTHTPKSQHYDTTEVISLRLSSFQGRRPQSFVCGGSILMQVMTLQPQDLPRQGKSPGGGGGGGSHAGIAMLPPEVAGITSTRPA